MFLKLGKSRQRSSKRMFLSQTIGIAKVVSTHARSVSVIVADRLHSALPIAEARRSACKCMQGWAAIAYAAEVYSFQKGLWKKDNNN